VGTQADSNLAAIRSVVESPPRRAGEVSIAGMTLVSRISVQRYASLRVTFATEPDAGYPHVQICERER